MIPDRGSGHIAMTRDNLLLDIQHFRADVPDRLAAGCAEWKDGIDSVNKVTIVEVSFFHLNNKYEFEIQSALLIFTMLHQCRVFKKITPGDWATQQITHFRKNK